MTGHLPLIISGLGAALVIAAILFKQCDDWLAARRAVSRRLKAPIRGNALVNWRRL